MQILCSRLFCFNTPQPQRSIQYRLTGRSTMLSCRHDRTIHGAQVGAHLSRRFEPRACTYKWTYVTFTLEAIFLLAQTEN